MEFLRLLLQLFKASLGIDVDGILCDLALEHDTHQLANPRSPGPAHSGGALHMRKYKGRRTMLKRCLKV